jgi:hypothetical protein
LAICRADLTSANLTGCRIFGVSAWALKLSKGTKQQNLLITRPEEPEITVDDIEIAQFIYLLLHNEKIRKVIDTIGQKAVLILGSFAPKRKPVFDALREELRRYDYVPIMFDFSTPASKTTLETVSTLAHLSRFVIADLTDAKSVLEELTAIVPMNPSVPVQPIILSEQYEPGMCDFFHMFHPVLETYRYDNPRSLISNLAERVIRPAEARVLSLRRHLQGLRRRKGA